MKDKFLVLLLVSSITFLGAQSIPESFRKVWENYSTKSSFKCDVSYKSFANNAWSDELKGEFLFYHQQQKYKFGKTEIVNLMDNAFIIDHDNKQVIITNNHGMLWDISKLTKLIENKQLVFDCSKSNEIFIQSSDGLNIMSIQHDSDFKPIRIVITTVEGITAPHEPKRNSVLVIDYSNYKELKSNIEFNTSNIANLKDNKWILSEPLKDYQLIN